MDYTGEGTWDTAFINEQIALVPPVQVVHEMPAPLSVPEGQSNHQVKYYLLRHGQSTANVDEIISSDRFTLSYTEKHGLTVLGTQQATASAQPLLQMIQQQQQESTSEDATKDPNIHKRHHRLIFVSSPFARARQTALACLHGVQELVHQNADNHQDQHTLEIVPSIWIHNALVERYFGNYDNDTLETYGYVWPLDQLNVTHTTYNVESVAAVATRIQSFLVEMNQYIRTQYDSIQSNNHDEQDHPTTNHVVLVSHGDVVQIAQLYAANASNIGEFSSYRFQSTYR